MKASLDMARCAVWKDGLDDFDSIAARQEVVSSSVARQMERSRY